MTSYPRGVVWNHVPRSLGYGEVRLNGDLIGHVVRRARVAAGTAGVKHDAGTLAAGTRKHFYTANQEQGKNMFWRPGNGASIGTRFPTGMDAVRALVLFHTEFRHGDWYAYNGSEWQAERKRRWKF